MEKRTVLEHLDIIVLALDEMIDRGYVSLNCPYFHPWNILFLFSVVIETDVQTVTTRVAKRAPETLELNFSEQSITQALMNARDQFARSLLK